MKLLGFIGAASILIITVIIVIIFYMDSQKTSKKPVIADEQINKTSPQPTPSINYKTIDDYLDYKIPTNWKKEVTDQVIEDTRVILLKSPNFRYNSAEGKDDGLEIGMVRQKFTANTTLKEKLVADGNPYVEKKDFKVTSVTINGEVGYYFPSVGDGIGYDSNFPHIAVLKDGYRYNFLFYGANGKGQRQAVDSFIGSVKFK